MNRKLVWCDFFYKLIKGAIISKGAVMKNRKSQALMIFAAATACAIFAVLSFAGQAASYVAEQEGKHIFLAQTKEDMGELRSCLTPFYRPAAKPELSTAAPNVSAVMPPATIIPSIVQPAQTAIAASPRPEITTGMEDKH